MKWFRRKPPKLKPASLFKAFPDAAEVRIRRFASRKHCVISWLSQRYEVIHQITVED